MVEAPSLWAVPGAMPGPPLGGVLPRVPGLIGRAMTAARFVEYETPIPCSICGTMLTPRPWGGSCSATPATNRRTRPGPRKTVGSLG